MRWRYFVYKFPFPEIRKDVEEVFEDDSSKTCEVGGGEGGNSVGFNWIRLEPLSTESFLLILNSTEVPMFNWISTKTVENYPNSIEFLIG